MTNLTISWIILTIPILLFGAGLMLDKEKEDFGRSIGSSILLFVSTWWGIYFIIKNFTP